MTVEVPPCIVAVSSEAAFCRLIESLLDSRAVAVRTTSDWESAPHLVKRVRPRLVILDLLPGREKSCWVVLEALRACPQTRATPVLVCPAAGSPSIDVLLALRGVQVWPEGFELDTLLQAVDVALAA